MRTLAIGAAVSLMVCASAWIVAGGSSGLVYLILYAVATAPGLPLGFLLFGSRHPGGWIAGGALGYALTAVAIWTPIAASIPAAPPFVFGWLTLTVITTSVWWRARGPLVGLAPFDRAAVSGLAIVLLLSLAVSVPPLSRVGAIDATGNRNYRAYFTADFVWHAALTAELSKFSMPPRNPYLASQPIHYYWTYFLLPAAVSETGPAPVRDVQTCLKVNALATGLLLLSSVFLAAWAAVGRGLPVTIAVVVALLAGSAEGAYELYRLWSRGQPLALLRDTNIDAITAWLFGGHRIDGLPRCLWYVPQHSMAYALGLIALSEAAAIGSAGSPGAVLLAGVALGGASAMNPFVGGIFALAWGAAIVIHAIRHPNAVRRVLHHAIAAVPVLLAVIWCTVARMVEGAGGVLEFGLHGASLHAPVISLLLSLGPVLVAVVAGIALRSTVELGRVIPALVLAAISLLLMYGVRLRVDPEWVPFRAGQMLLVAAPALMARGFAGLWPTRRALAIAFVGLLLVAGLPTTVIDARNASDVANSGDGPGFRWTLAISPDEQQAFTWIRRVTPETAIVQMEPTIRDRLNPANHGEQWSMIPSFAERRMAAGLPISLMHVPAYDEHSGMVKTLFATMDPHEGWSIARRLRIGYVYVDGLDRQTYAGAAKFDSSPEYFAPAFKRGSVGVYQVR